MKRRSFLEASLAGLAAMGWAGRKKYRIGVIGHTGRGNYGHGLDTVWRAFDDTEVVAVADPDEEGRAQARERTGAQRDYRDYHRMLDGEKLDIVAIAPRWLDQRAAMTTAAAEAGCHIFHEKSFAPSLTDADRMVAAVERNRVKVQMAHQMRTSPFVTRVKAMIEAGEIGMIQEVRGRGKEDRRAGGEDLMVLGSHICDMMRYFLGDPKWVFSHVTEDGKEVGRGQVREATEPIGPVAGNQIAAVFSFAGGIHAYFGSKASDRTDRKRFGLWLYGSKGVIHLPNDVYPRGRPYILRSPGWLPDETHRWEPIEAQPPAASRFRAEGHTLGNALLVADLLEAIEQDRKPACSEQDGRWTIEMITSVYQSQKTGARVDLPLEDRRHPLAIWG
jgi:predicted dehydrogenase